MQRGTALHAVAEVQALLKLDGIPGLETQSDHQGACLYKLIQAQ